LFVKLIYKLFGNVLSLCLSFLVSFEGREYENEHSVVKW
jgi:hypothetical protein